MEAMTEKVPLTSVIITGFKKFPDNRKPFKVYYELSEVLFLVFCSLLCGCSSFEEISDFGQLKLDWLRKHLPYKKGIPSHDTINRLLSILNTKQLEKVLSGICQYSIHLTNGSIVNIDGKRLSGSATIKEQQTKNTEGGRHAVVMVNVYCDAVKACLASIEVSGKSGEKNAITEILEVLDLSNCILTLDAGYCYTDVAKEIIEAQADYVMGVKKNQPKLLAAAEQLLSQDSNTETYAGKEEDSHGRLEQRTCKVVNLSKIDQSLIEPHKAVLDKWEGLMCLIMICSFRKVKATGKSTSEKRYYIASIEMMPERACRITREHWGIENKLHWVLDAVMGEDKSKKRAGNTGANFSVLQKIALNIIKNHDDPKANTKRKFRKCLFSDAYLESTLKIS